MILVVFLDEEVKIVSSVVGIVFWDMMDDKMNKENEGLVCQDGFVFCIELEFVLFFGDQFELSWWFLFWQLVVFFICFVGFGIKF